MEILLMIRNAADGELENLFDAVSHVEEARFYQVSEHDYKALIKIREILKEEELL